MFGMTIPHFPEMQPSINLENRMKAVIFFSGED